MSGDSTRHTTGPTGGTKPLDLQARLLDPRQSKPLTYPDKLAASIAEVRITYQDRSCDWGAGGECRLGHVRRGFGFLQITRDRLGLELSHVISANIKVMIPVISR